MQLIDIVYPDCHLCRTLRIAMCLGVLIVIGTYMVQLITISWEMRKEHQHGRELRRREQAHRPQEP